jgi:nitrogen fixation/metabolism regulation signal transduction histidine kinase
MVVAAAALFWIFQRQIAGPSPAFYMPDEIVPALEESLEDQKRLAELDPEAESHYRSRFDEIEKTTGRLRILEHNRERLVGRYEMFLLALLALSVALATGYLAVRHSAYRPRLTRVQEALGELAAGQTPVAIGDRRKDMLGRISRMIEETSREIARDRRRLRALRNLSHWQEAARRHAHEMRTPLSGARLTLDRLRGLGEEGREEAFDALGFELERLGRFTEEFASFARLRPPELKRENLGRLIHDFVETYAEAWQNLKLEPGGNGEVEVAIDRDMMRQVLANLCDNSSRALGDENGTVEMTVRRKAAEVHVELADDGPGIPEAVRDRLFEPYTTTRSVGEGMGLGLAISRKILLDHGGDLELLDSTSEGTTFRLTLPVQSTA